MQFVAKRRSYEEANFYSPAHNGSIDGSGIGKHATVRHRGRTLVKIASTKRISLVIVIAMVVTLMGSSSAFGAEKLLLSATRKGNWTGTGAVPLDDAQHLALSFDTTTTGVLKITYNAECGVVGSSGWGSVQIWVDNQQADPASGTTFAFCTAEGNTYHYIGAVRQSFISVPIGTGHVVQVTANGVGGVSKVWLGDSSIVVEQK